VLKNGTVGVLGEEHSGVLQKNLAKPDEELEKLFEGHIIGQRVVSSAGKEGGLLPFNPWEDLAQKLRGWL
jgi:hypothetical protein